MIPTCTSRTPSSRRFTSFFFTSNLGVFGCSVGGCSGPPQGFGSGYQETGLAASGGYVYWGDDLTNSIYRCTTPCSAGPTVIEADASEPYGTALDSTSIWWTGRGIVASCPQSGCNGSPSSIASSPAPGYIAVDGTNAYWWNAGYPDAGHTDIFRCAKTGCGKNPTSIATEPSFKNVGTVAVDGQSVYWVADGTLMQLTPK